MPNRYCEMAECFPQDEPGMKSKDSGLSSMDGESNSDNEDQSQGDPADPPGQAADAQDPQAAHGAPWQEVVSRPPAQGFWAACAYRYGLMPAKSFFTQ